jgi:TonB family protein
LKTYIENWRAQVEEAANSDYAGQGGNGGMPSRSHPIVTVSIRNDGSIEGMRINRSSGQAEVDDTVRRIVQRRERYDAFPPQLARRYDVIEVRRLWAFDERLKLLVDGN